jgi:hypothetical protein
MIRSEIIDALVAAGATAEMLAAAFKADQARSSGARRQAAYRARKASLVTLRDVTEHNVMSRTPPPNKNSPTPPKELTPTPEKPKPLVLAKKTKFRTSIREDDQPTSKDELFASDNGMNSTQIQIEWAQFRDHHLAKGNLMADWHGAWRTWVRNAAKFGGVSANGHGRSNGTEGFVRSVLEDIENDRRRCEESNSKTVPMLQFDRERH